MKDEHDHYTQDMHEAAKPKPKRRRKRAAKGARQLLIDADSFRAAQVGKVSEVAQVRHHSPISAAYFVPVAFVAKDWSVSPRRVRALLAAGRLVGQLLPNGYWEVRFPYLYSEGLRGPAPKRHQLPARPRAAKKAESSAEGIAKPC